MTDTLDRFTDWWRDYGRCWLLGAMLVIVATTLAIWFLLSVILWVENQRPDPLPYAQGSIVDEGERT